MGALLQARTGLPVYVANDSQATALAEHVFGGPRVSNLVVVKVGEGIGAGLILGGRLFQGDGFGAGEIGHMTVQPGGDACRCGRRGCLETIASTRAILGRLAGHGISRLPDAIAALEAGDPLVRDVVVAAGRQLGVAVAWLIGVLNVERIVLVGSAAEFGEPWLNAVRETMAGERPRAPGQGHHDRDRPAARRWRGPRSHRAVDDAGAGTEPGRTAAGCR